MAITEGTQPAPKTWTGAWTTNQTTASFTPESGALLVALVSGDGAGTGTITATVSDSLGGTWTLLKRQNTTAGGVVGGTAEVWCRDSPGSSLTVSVLGTGAAMSTGGQLVIRTLIGAKATATQTGATNGATFNSGAVQTSVTAGTGNKVYGAAFNFSSSTAMTLLGNTSDVANFVDTTNGDNWAAFKSTGDTAGTATYGYSTSTQGMIAAVEILASPATGGAPTPTRPGKAWLHRFHHRQILPLASVDVVFAAAGSATAQQHTEVATVGARSTAGPGIASGRAAVTSIGRKGAAAPTSEQQRAAAAVTSSKSGIGSGLAVGRATSASTGTSATAATGASATVQRSATSSAGRKTATSTNPDQQRSTTGTAGTKATVGATSQQQRSSLATAGTRATSGAGLDVQRASTLSAGAAVTGISGAGRTTQRSSVAATGRKTATVTALAQVRGTTADTGTRRAIGAAVASVRILDGSAGLRATSGLARVVQRLDLRAAGAGPVLIFPTARRTLVVPADPRALIVTASRRIVIVTLDLRVVTVAAERRIVTVPARAPTSTERP